MVRRLRHVVLRFTVHLRSAAPRLHAACCTFPCVRQPFLVTLCSPPPVYSHGPRLFVAFVPAVRDLLRRPHARRLSTVAPGDRFLPTGTGTWQRSFLARTVSATARATTRSHAQQLHHDRVRLTQPLRWYHLWMVACHPVRLYPTCVFERDCGSTALAFIRAKTMRIYGYPAAPAWLGESIRYPTYGEKHLTML